MPEVTYKLFISYATGSASTRCADVGSERCAAATAAREQ